MRIEGLDYINNDDDRLLWCFFSWLYTQKTNSFHTNEADYCTCLGYQPSCSWTTSFHLLSGVQFQPLQMYSQQSAEKIQWKYSKKFWYWMLISFLNLYVELRLYIIDLKFGLLLILYRICNNHLRKKFPLWKVMVKHFCCTGVLFGLH